MPIANAEEANVATPALSNPVPIAVPASRNVTVPVGVPAPGAAGETVAVKVTDWPKREGFAEEMRAVVELSLLTTWGFPVKAVGPLPLKFVSLP